MKAAPPPSVRFFTEDPSIVGHLGAALREYADLVRLQPWRASPSRMDRPVAIEVIDLQHSDASARLRTSENNGALPPPHRIALTRVADLAEALLWKNAGGVHRYLQWPRDEFDLSSTIRALLHDWLRISGYLDVLELRPVSSAEELDAVIRFRYRVYSAGRFTRWAVENRPHAIDVDDYDQTAHIFGLWRHLAEGWCLVGTVRAVGRAPGPHRIQLRELAQSRPESASSPSNAEALPFPILHLGHDRAAVLAWIEQLEVEGPVFELSKHAVDQAHRTRDTDRLQLEGLAAFMLAQSGARVHGLAGTPALLARAFRPFGFQEVPGAGIWPVPTADGGAIESVAIWTRFPDMASPEVRRRVEYLVPHANGNGGSDSQTLCFCRNYPRCLERGYRTGRLARDEIFCPAQFLDRATDG